MYLGVVFKWICRSPMSFLLWWLLQGHSRTLHWYRGSRYTNYTSCCGAPNTTTCGVNPRHWCIRAVALLLGCTAWKGPLWTVSGNFTKYIPIYSLRQIKYLTYAKSFPLCIRSLDVITPACLAYNKRLLKQSLNTNFKNLVVAKMDLLTMKLRDQSHT